MKPRSKLTMSYSMKKKHQVIYMHQQHSHQAEFCFNHVLQFNKAAPREETPDLDATDPDGGRALKNIYLQQHINGRRKTSPETSTEGSNPLSIKTPCASSPRSRRRCGREEAEKGHF